MATIVFNHHCNQCPQVERGENTPGFGLTRILEASIPSSNVRNLKGVFVRWTIAAAIDS
jgi:hypothetical protein